MALHMVDLAVRSFGRPKQAHWDAHVFNVAMQCVGDGIANGPAGPEAEQHAERSV